MPGVVQNHWLHRGKLGGGRSILRPSATA